MGRGISSGNSYQISGSHVLNQPGRNIWCWQSWTIFGRGSTTPIPNYLGITPWNMYILCMEPKITQLKKENHDF